MVPRVLMVQPGPAARRPEPVEVETVVATDGDAALARLRCERFDAVVVDLGLPPLDGWFVLATVGAWAERPRLTALVADPAEAERARRLGADSCLTAGTCAGARALERSTKENEWHAPPRTGSRRPTTVGASA